MVNRWKARSTIYLLLPVLVLCGLITSCAPTLVSPTDPNSSLVIGRIVINNKHSGRYFGILPLGTLDQGLEVEVESRDESQFFKVVTEEQGYFFIPNIPPNRYQVRKVSIEGFSGSQRERRGIGMRRLNFTPVPGKIVYIGTLFIDFSEREKKKIREVREEEKARAYLREKHGDSAWTSRKFTTAGTGRAPTIQVAKKVEQQQPAAKPVSDLTLKAEKTEWKIGNWWEYAWKRPDKSGTYTREVIREDTFEGTSCYVIKRGRREYYYTKDVLGYIARKSKGRVDRKRTPPMQLLSWPLEIGKEWENPYLLERPKEKTSVTVDRRLVVAKVEEVKVPAGTFKTFKIERYTSFSGKLFTEYWYSPKVKWFVKIRRYRRNGVRETELINYKVD